MRVQDRYRGPQARRNAHNGVTDVTLDTSAVFAHSAGCEIVKSPGQFVRGLRAYFAGKVCVIGEVNEQYRDRTPLQSAGDIILPGNALTVTFEARDGAQQALAISEWDLQLFEVLIGKIGQHVEINAMLGEEPAYRSSLDARTTT
jgi:hypothetical protein